MLVLGIETSCDETAIALVEDGEKILSNVIASQIEKHRPYGGVFPELASREHLLTIIPTLEESFREAGKSLEEVDLIAVASAPGLIGSLLIGVNLAKSLSLAKGIPLIGVNHIEAHIASALIGEKEQEEEFFPALGVVISGGHTALVFMKSLFETEVISHTVDDAIGEAFDKVAKLLELPYPGGPEIEKLALLGNPQKYPFRPGKIKEKPLYFSFSGLKTAVLYTLKKDPHFLKEDIAASFQHTVFQDLLEKVTKSAKERGCKSLLFGGGVACSKTLRKYFEPFQKEFLIRFPKPGLALDNGAMIASWGYHTYKKRGKGDGLHLEAKSRGGFS